MTFLGLESQKVKWEVSSQNSNSSPEITSDKRYTQNGRRWTSKMAPRPSGVGSHAAQRSWCYYCSVEKTVEGEKLKLKLKHLQEAPNQLQVLHTAFDNDMPMVCNGFFLFCWLEFCLTVKGQLQKFVWP